MSHFVSLIVRRSMCFVFVHVLDLYSSAMLADVWLWWDWGWADIGQCWVLRAETGGRGRGQGGGGCCCSQAVTLPDAWPLPDCSAPSHQRMCSGHPCPPLEMSNVCCCFSLAERKPVWWMLDEPHQSPPLPSCRLCSTPVWAASETRWSRWPRLLKWSRGLRMSRKCWER